MGSCNVSRGAPDWAANENLDAQIEFFGGGYAISLDAIWRAAGRPKGKDPESWAISARPLVHGFALYLTAIDTPTAEGDILYRTDLEAEALDGDDCPDNLKTKEGDLVAGGVLARHYATYLDRRMG